jgi:hypothetical protein
MIIARAATVALSPAIAPSASPTPLACECHRHNQPTMLNPSSELSVRHGHHGQRYSPRHSHWHGRDRRELDGAPPQQMAERHPNMSTDTHRTALSTATLAPPIGALGQTPRWEPEV